MARSQFCRPLTPVSAAIIVLGTAALYVLAYATASGIGTSSSMHGPGGYYTVFLDWETLARLAVCCAIAGGAWLWLRARRRPEPRMGWYGPTNRSAR